MPIIFTVAGCPTFDPLTQSRIDNHSADAIEIELVLDTNQWRPGFTEQEFEGWLAERSDEWIGDELRIYADRGQGVTLATLEPERFAGRYFLAPQGTMIIDDSMGTEPTIPLNKLTIKYQNETIVFADHRDIIGLFRPSEERDRLFEFSITTEWLKEMLRN